MELSEVIPQEGVLFALRSGSKRQALSELVSLAEGFVGVPQRRILDAVLERERLGSTGIGGGVAIPHARLPEVERPWGFFARLDRPIEFGAVDEQPVDLVFLLLTPATAGADHLKMLARISRLLRQQATEERLRAAHDAAVVYSVLTEPVAVTAA
ncbi:MAG: PTS sugar transporter subunit IIA [Alphaproteobacteria bacterium]